VTFPKIELHVHLEATVRAPALLQIARRNDVALPADSVEGLAGLYEYRDFGHFLDTWLNPALLAELAARGTVLDVCPVSNLRPAVVASLAEHPLPALVAAGIPCSVPTDDPAMFGTDLGLEYQVAAQLGVAPRDCYAAGAAGALCDEATRATLTTIGQNYDWGADPVAPGAVS
jgi:aminodeoxyfutalosine deaminase